MIMTTMMMIRRQSLPNGNVRLWLAFVCAAFVFVLPVRQAAPLFPSAYLYDQGGHSGYDGGGGGGGSGIFGKQFFMNGRHHQHQSPAVHYQEFDPPAQTLHFAPPPPVQYEWQEDNGPRVHSGGGSGDDYADEDYRGSSYGPGTVYGNKDGGYNYGGVGGSGRHGRQMHSGDQLMFHEYPQVSSPFYNLPKSGGEVLKYFSDHELLPSDQHYYDNSNSGGMEHVQENVPITVLYKTLSSPFNQHQQQHIFDLNGDHYEGGGGGSGDHFPHYIHRVTKPVIAEIHEIITPLRKGGSGAYEQTSIQVKDDYNMRPIPLPPPPMSPTIHHLLNSHQQPNHHPQSHLQSPAHHLTSSSSPHYQQTDRKLPPSHSNNNKHSFSASEVSFSSHPSSSFSSSSSSSSHLPRFNYSLMKDRNSHNFGIFNKAYDLALSMNKANGYMLSGGGGGGGNGAGGGSSHPNSNNNNGSQGHVEVTGGGGGAAAAAGVNGSEMDEPQSDASNHEESSVINNSANGGGGGRDNNGNNGNNGNISNLQPQQV